MFQDLDNESVPESTAANADGGAAKLDADPISQDLSNQIDAALDAAEAGDLPAPAVEDSPEKYTREVAPPAPEEPKEEVYQPKVEIDPEIAAIQMPPNMSEKQQSNWRKLTESASIAKKQAAEAEILRQRLAELESKKQEQKLPEDYEELRRFRSVFDMKNDPSFKEKYDKPIAQAEESIYGLLKKHRASEEVIKSIQDAGGPGKVSKAWWKQNAIDRLYATEDGFTDARRLENALVQIDDIEAARNADLESATSNQEKWMQEREAEQQQREVEETKSVNEYIESITKDKPTFRFKEIPAGATQEQIEKIEQHNAGVADLQNKFRSALKPSTPQERAAVAAAATLSHVITQQLRIEQQQKAEMQVQIEKLMKENSALKSSGKMPKSSVSTTNPPKSNASDRIKMSASDAIDLGLEEAGA
jgi:hypothetical protein